MENPRSLPFFLKLAYLAKNVLTDRRTIFVVLYDASLFVGVYMFDWEPLKFIGFYYLDICFAFLSFVVYAYLIREVYESSKAFFGMVMLSFIAWLYFTILIYFSHKMGFSNYTERPLELFQPYLNLIPFILLSFISHVFNVKKYLTIEKAVAKPSFALFLAVNFLAIPGLILLTYLFNMVLPSNLSLVISFILTRNYMEYMRISSLIGNGFVIANNRKHELPL